MPLIHSVLAQALPTHTHQVEAMDAGTQAALRVVLNVTRLRPTPAEECDTLLHAGQVLEQCIFRLRDENTRLRNKNFELIGEIAAANEESYRLNDVVEDLREENEDQAFEIEGWKNMCDEVNHRHRHIIKNQRHEIRVLKAKLRMKKRGSGKVQKAVKPRELKNK